MRLASALLCLCLALSCTTTKSKSPAAPAVGKVPPCCAAGSDLTPEEASDGSIYQLRSQWRDDLGKQRILASLAGRPQVISMGYSTCKFACPRLLADMRLIESGLPAEVAANAGFVFVSIDPQTDTPQRLAAYRTENRLDSTRWTLLCGDEDAVQELAVVLGIQYRRIGDSDFAHSNVITVVNADGEIVHRQEGLAADPAASIRAVVTVSNRE